jgi:hypothetical protein
LPKIVPISGKPYVLRKLSALRKIRTIGHPTFGLKASLESKDFLTLTYNCGLDNSFSLPAEMVTESLQISEVFYISHILKKLLETEKIA